MYMHVHAYLCIYIHYGTIFEMFLLTYFSIVSHLEHCRHFNVYTDDKGIAQVSDKDVLIYVCKPGLSVCQRMLCSLLSTVHILLFCIEQNPFYIKETRWDNTYTCIQ